MESRGALLTVVVPLLAFKIWFAILLVMYAPTRDTVVWIAATHWTLIFVIGLLIVAGIPTYRLLKVRAKRERLRRAEFMLEQAAHRGPGPILDSSAPQCSALWDTVSRLEGGD